MFRLIGSPRAWRLGVQSMFPQLEPLPCVPRLSKRFYVDSQKPVRMDFIAHAEGVSAQVRASYEILWKIQKLLTVNAIPVEPITKCLETDRFSIKVSFNKESVCPILDQILEPIACKRPFTIKIIQVDNLCVTAAIIAREVSLLDDMRQELLKQLLPVAPGLAVLSSGELQMQVNFNQQALIDTLEREATNALSS